MITAFLEPGTTPVNIYYNNRLTLQPDFWQWEDIQIIISGNTVQIIGRLLGQSQVGHYYKFDDQGNYSGPYCMSF